MPALEMSRVSVRLHNASGSGTSSYVSAKRGDVVLMSVESLERAGALVATGPSTSDQYSIHFAP